jgi:hypothetical protein
MTIRVSLHVVEREEDRSISEACPLVQYEARWLSGDYYWVHQNNIYDDEQGRIIGVIHENAITWL